MIKEITIDASTETQQLILGQIDYHTWRKRVSNMVMHHYVLQMSAEERQMLGIEINHPEGEGILSN